MPSSKDRRRLEVPTYIHEQLVQIARSEDRTVTSVLLELLYPTLLNYRPRWVPSKHLDKFTERARNVFTLAVEEAQQLNHNYIGTEHLLLGLLREEGGVAARALNRLGVDLDKVRGAVESKIGRGAHPAEGQIEYVPRVRTVLGLAVDEAQRLGHNSVRTEHILLGIVREGGGVAADILDELGALGKVREQTLALVG